MPPKRFGKYEVLARLATGGAANIFLARQPGAAGFHKLVCLKTLLPERASDADFVAMFLDEARLAARLNHPNCVQIYDLGRVRGSYYISMEYIFGETLWNLLATVTKLRTPLPSSHVASIISSVCDGLHHAHELKDSNGRPFNLVHRDVSPQNVMVTFEGQTKVVDFGIAKAETGRAPTVAGIVKGKFSYMSPEQITGGAIDRRSDVYSLGIVLFECLASRRLYRGDSPEDIARLILEHRAPRLRDVVPDIPAELDAICATALARHPSKRFQTAHAMGEALRDYLDTTRYAHSAGAIAKLVEERFRGQIVERRKVFESALSGTNDEGHLLRVLDARAVREVDLFPEDVPPGDTDAESFVENDVVVDAESLIFPPSGLRPPAKTLSNETIDAEETTGEVSGNRSTTALGPSATGSALATGRSSVSAVLGKELDARRDAANGEEAPSDDGDRTCIDERGIESFADADAGENQDYGDSTSVDLEPEPPSIPTPAIPSSLGAAVSAALQGPSGDASRGAPLGSVASLGAPAIRDALRSTAESPIGLLATDSPPDRAHGVKPTRDESPALRHTSPPPIPGRRPTQPATTSRPTFGVSVEGAQGRQGPLVTRSRSQIAAEPQKDAARRSSVMAQVVAAPAEIEPPRVGVATSEKLAALAVATTGRPHKIADDADVEFDDESLVTASVIEGADRAAERARIIEPEALPTFSEGSPVPVPSRDGIRKARNGSGVEAPSLPKLEVAALPVASESHTSPRVPVTRATAVLETKFGSAALLAALGFGIAIGIILGLVLARILYATTVAS